MKEGSERDRYAACGIEILTEFELREGRIAVCGILNPERLM